MARICWVVFFTGLVSACFKKTPPNVNALLQQKGCIEALENNDLTRARTHCELCIEYDKSMPECLNGLGLIAFLEHKNKKAEDYFRKALRQNNDFAQARNNLGVLHFQTGNFSEALTFFDRALEIDPSNLDARYNSGLCHLRLFQKKRAQGKASLAHHHLIIAEKQVLKLLALEPTYHSAWRDLGLNYLYRQELATLVNDKKQLLAKAKESFKECTQEPLIDSDCFEGLGQVALFDDNYEEAYDYFFQCLGRDKLNNACKKGIVSAYEQGSKRVFGFKTWSDKVKQAENPQAHEAFCSALFDKGFHEAAITECQHALRLNNNLCQAHLMLGEHFAKISNTEQASKHCRAFLLCEEPNKNLTGKKICEDAVVLKEHYNYGHHAHH